MTSSAEEVFFPVSAHAKRCPSSPFDVGAASTAGCDGENQDSFFIGALKPAMTVTQASGGGIGEQLYGSQSALLMIVADGLGGLSLGALASRLAVEEAACFTLENVTHRRLNTSSTDSSRATIPGLRGQLAEAIQASDSRVRQAGAVSEDLGSTLTIGYVVWPFLYVAHVGDTRAYVLRDNRLVQLTQDHVFQSQGDEFDKGADYWHRVLWNTVGDQHSLARPDLNKFTLQPHDQWLFCSDGLHQVLSASEIVDICQAASTSTQAARELVAAAQAAGAQDDVTVACGRRLMPPPS